MEFGAGGRGVLVAGTEPPDVVELWDWTLGPGDTHVSEAHTAGTKELLQVQEGTVTRCGRRRGVHPRGRRRGPFPATWSTRTPTRARNRPGSPWPSSSRAWGQDTGRRRPMRELDSFRSSWTAPGSMPQCSRCGRTTAPCCWPSTGSSRAQATRPVTRCSRRRRPQPAKRSATGLWSISPHVAAWREAYRSFGAKPQRTRNSLEALLRRAASGLPRVNRLTDIYNAVSVLHQVPLGGEDLTRYSGAPRLLRATGTEPFDTVADGAEVIEHPEPGEVVWCDDAGVTCRRWNWRQGRRTQLARRHHHSAVHPRRPPTHDR